MAKFSLAPDQTIAQMWSNGAGGRVGNRYVWQGGQTENQGGQTNFFSRILSNKCLPTVAWNPAGAPATVAYQLKTSRPLMSTTPPPDWSPDIFTYFDICHWLRHSRGDYGKL